MSIETKAEKQEADIKMIVYRLSSFESLESFFGFEFSKAAQTWCEGKFMQDAHIDWGFERGGIYDFIIKDREFYPLFNIYTVIFVYVLYIFAAAGALCGVKLRKES